MRKCGSEKKLNRRRLKGSIMMTSVVMMTIAGVGAMGWVGYITEASRGAGRDRSRTHALYAAESGVEAVVDFFNNPGNYEGEEPEAYVDGAHPHGQYPLSHSVEPNWYGLFEPYIVSYALDKDDDPLYRDGSLVTNRTTHFKDLSAGSDQAISNTSKIPTSELDIEGNEDYIFRHDNGNIIAWIERIQLIHPSEAGIDWSVVPPNLRIITVVESTGRTPDGVEVTLSSIVTENNTFEISSPGPIISRASATYNGNFNVHWGEMWTASDVELANNFTNKVPREDEDPWFRFRTQGVFKDNKGRQYADGSSQGGFRNSPINKNRPNYEIPFLESTLNKKNNKLRGYENIRQHQDLEFPDFPYDEWKRFVLDQGFRYYYTDTGGTIYGTETDPSSDQFGQTVGKSYEQWFNISPNDPEYNTVSDMVAFVDSIPVNDSGVPAPKDENGVPIINDEYYPRNPSILDGDPAARMATIRQSGGGIHSRGAIFMAADMELTGQGNPPSSNEVPDVKKPDGTTPDKAFNVFHNGFMHVWGTIETKGNRTFYGSIMTEGGYASSGTPEVYYNVGLQDGSWLNLNVSRVRRVIWNFADNTRFSEGGE